MSLESKIEKLTAAVESLTERLHSMEAMVAIPPSAPAPSEPEAPTPTPPTGELLEQAAKEEALKAEPEITHEQVQQLCLKIVRDDRSKKPKLKEILGEYGANLVQDVPSDKLAELKQKLEAA